MHLFAEEPENAFLCGVRGAAWQNETSLSLSTYPRQRPASRPRPPHLPQVVTGRVESRVAGNDLETGSFIEEDDRAALADAGPGSFVGYTDGVELKHHGDVL